MNGRFAEKRGGREQRRGDVVIKHRSSWKGRKNEKTKYQGGEEGVIKGIGTEGGSSAGGRKKGTERPYR